MPAAGRRTQLFILSFSEPGVCGFADHCTQMQSLSKCSCSVFTYHDQGRGEGAGYESLRPDGGGGRRAAGAPATLQEGTQNAQGLPRGVSQGPPREQV